MQMKLIRAEYQYFSLLTVFIAMLARMCHNELKEAGGAAEVTRSRGHKDAGLEVLG